LKPRIWTFLSFSKGKGTSYENGSCGKASTMRIVSGGRG
jgi:hypothetical protein